MYLGSLSKEQDDENSIEYICNYIHQIIIDTGDLIGSYINNHKYFYHHRLQGAWTLSNGKLL